MVFQMVAGTAFRLCHAAALALVGWVLIFPPIAQDSGGEVWVATGAPVDD